MSILNQDDLSEKLNTLNLILGKGGGLTSEIKDLNVKLGEFIIATNHSREKTEKSNTINQILTFVIAITAVLSLANIYISDKIKNEAIRSNQIAQQPFLDLVADIGVPVRYTNKGKGVAMNIFVVKWNNNDQKIYITKEGNVSSALAIEQEVVFDIKKWKKQI